MSITNYQELRVVVRGAPNNGCVVVVENRGASTIWNLHFSTYELLGPPAFGLDDTHMREGWPSAAPVEIASLQPGEFVSVLRENWRALEDYCGATSGNLYATFSTHENGERSLGLRATFEVVGLPERRMPQRTVAFAEHHPNAFSIGKFVGKIFRRIRYVCASKRSPPHS